MIIKLDEWLNYVYESQTLTIFLDLVSDRYDRASYVILTTNKSMF